MSTSTSPITPFIISNQEIESFREYSILRGNAEVILNVRKRRAPKCYYILPAAALLGSVFTYSQLLLGHFTQNEQNFVIGKYAGMATAGVVGLSILATLAETAVTKYHYGSEEACGAFKRSWRWLKKPEGIMINTLSAILPFTWCCWCREL